MPFQAKPETKSEIPGRGIRLAKTERSILKPPGRLMFFKPSVSVMGAIVSLGNSSEAIYSALPVFPL
jgi:hypothetical protein